MPASPSISRLLLTIAGVAGCVTLLAGCFGNSQSVDEIKEPPFVPAVEAPLTDSKQSEIPALYVGAYADLMDYGDQTRHSPRLLEAVAQAIRIGVLKPDGVQDKFNPENPITFNEFRQWATAYQTAAAGALRLKPTESDPKTSAMGINQPKELAPMARQPDELASPMNPARLMMMPADLSLGLHELAKNRPLNREELCALYVFLAHKQDLASALTVDAVESSTPGGNTLQADEALSMFKDYPAISDWAKPYVAIAYRDAILQKAFNLTGTQLTIDQGFDPSAEVSREEAILVLNHLYGYVKNPAPRHNQEKEASNIDNRASDPGLRGHYKPQETLTRPRAADSTTPGKTEPHPLKSLKTVQESGSEGSRNAIRMERAE